MFVIPDLGSLKQEDCFEYKVSLGDTILQKDRNYVRAVWMGKSAVRVGRRAVRVGGVLEIVSSGHERSTVLIPPSSCGCLGKTSAPLRQSIC